MERRKARIISYTLIAGAVLVAAFCCIPFLHGKPTATLDVEPGVQEEAPDSTTTQIRELNKLITNETFEADPNIDRKVRAYMTQWNINGASLAVTRGDSLIYAKGYGKADEGVEMQPGHILRVASVSKLITAVAVMKLQEEGLVKLSDLVFGADGILNDDIYLRGIGKKAGFKSITVEHLLRHQAGFRRDPMFGIVTLMRETRSSAPLTHDQTVALGLSGKLRFNPGEGRKYSNIGYFFLCDIIEKLAGIPYEEYVQTHVLEPAGIYDMHVGRNWYEEKRENEVRYYVHDGEGKYITDYRDTSATTERCYGGNDIQLLSGAGGWTASAIELAQLVASIDGEGCVEDVLSEDSVKSMTEHIEDAYSLGWNSTNPEEGWQRSGTLSGTSTLIYRFPDGECWVFLMNTSTSKGPRQAQLTETLFRNCRKQD